MRARLEAQSVCAIVITYHPTLSMIENLSAICSQVDEMVVVDNGSNSEALDSLRRTSQNLRFSLIENGQNLGIAEALNQGVHWAIEKSFPWVILFDQDSVITGNFVDEMLSTWATHPLRDRLGAIHPRYLDHRTGIEAYVWRAADNGPVRSMTSGALIPTWIFGKLGWFASDFFIDDVDTEYCFRVRAAGYLLADSRSAILRHSSGSPRSITWLGRTFSPSHHSAWRRYYISRNRTAVCRKYFLVFPVWTLRYAYDCARETIKCFLGESDRRRKFRNVVLGIWDGLTGRMGARRGL
jgi:rhamnosyltransferase